MKTKKSRTLENEQEIGTALEVAFRQRDLARITGVYLIRDEKGVVHYVGHTIQSVRARIRHHVRRMNHNWIVSVVPGDAARERELIEAFLPDFNIQHSIGARRRSLEYRMAKIINNDGAWWKRLPDLRKRTG